MSLIADMTRASLSRLRGLLDSPTFTWMGTPVPCVPNTLGVGSIVSDGGYEMTVSLTLYVNRDDFAAAISADSTLITVDSELYTVDNGTMTPVSGKVITYQGAQRRITKAMETPDGACIVLMCADVNS